MPSCFWENLEKARIKAGIERKAIEKSLNISNNAFSRGTAEKNSPSVDRAFQLAKSVNLSMEELVAGEEGLNYIRDIILSEPELIRVPPKIRPIVECLLLLNKRDLKGILAQVSVLAEDKKGNILESTG